MGYPAALRSPRREEQVLARNKARAKTPQPAAASARTKSAASGWTDLDPARWAAVFVGFVVISLFVYGPVLHGDFISDDGHYVLNNPYVHTLDLANLIAIWDPTSVLAVAIENYAPVHLMLHALEWQAFGPNVLGYHVVNIVLHALAAALLIPIFRRSGIALVPVLFGAAIFLLHPANVESVAWISQLKSSSALVLSLCAILLHPRRPFWASVVFALALFAKPFSAFALIVVAVIGWVRTGARDPEADGASTQDDFRWPWLIAWGVAVAGFALAEIAAFSQSAGLAPPLYADLLVRYATIFSVALRYLIMAVTGYGLSTFHEPAPIESLFDPWFLGSIVVLGLLAWRVFVCLRRRNEELVYWVWAIVSFGPLSGVVPLPYPMADRYLYFVLPGLIGASLLALQSEEPRILGLLSGDGDRTANRQSALRKATAVTAGLLLVVYGGLAHGRADVYGSADALMADAERNYPNGVAANTRKATRAARAGNYDGAVRHLRLAHARGYNKLDNILQDPSFGAMQNHPGFVELKREMADEWLSRLGANPNPSQVEARMIAQAWIVKDDLEMALRVIERAIDIPGPMTRDLEGDAEQLRREIALRKRLNEERMKRAP